MNVKITVKKIQDNPNKEEFKAYAYTEGFGLNAVGHTESAALYALHKKLKQMHKFTMLARATLETKMGWHNCTINFHKQILKENK